VRRVEVKGVALHPHTFLMVLHLTRGRVLSAGTRGRALVRGRALAEGC